MFSLFHLYVFSSLFQKNVFARKKKRPRLAVTVHAAGQSLSAHAALLLSFFYFLLFTYMFSPTLPIYGPLDLPSTYKYRPIGASKNHLFRVKSIFWFN